jgi:hypothetical protein
MEHANVGVRVRNQRDHKRREIHVNNNFFVAQRCNEAILSKLELACLNHVSIAAILLYNQRGQTWSEATAKIEAVGSLSSLLFFAAMRQRSEHTSKGTFTSVYTYMSERAGRRRGQKR